MKAAGQQLLPEPYSHRAGRRLYQSGQIMQAASLLSTDRNPTDEKIDQVMAGNLCRCGTYPRIRAAIHTAAGKLKEA